MLPCGHHSLHLTATISLNLALGIAKSLVVEYLRTWRVGGGGNWENRAENLTGGFAGGGGGGVKMGTRANLLAPQKLVE